MSGNRVPIESSFGPDQGIVAHQVDVVGDDDDVAPA